MNREDYRAMWMDARNETFLVKSLYATLKLGNSPYFLVGVIWYPWAPFELSFFVSEACWGKVLTLDQLQKGDGHWLIDVVYVKWKRIP